MSNRVDIVLLCEDRRHEQFVRAFLKGKKRRLARISFPKLYKSHEAGGKKRNNGFVLGEAVEEIDKARKVPPKRALILVIDGDKRGYASRNGQIASKLKAEKITALNEKECIALLVPCRNIETWVHHFKGNETDESTDFKSFYKDYNAAPEAQAFADWVSDGNAVEVAELPALNAARDELRRLHELMK